RHDGSLVDQVGKIGAGKARGQSGDLVKVHAALQSDLGHVDLQYLKPTQTIRSVDQQAAVGRDRAPPIDWWPRSRSHQSSDRNRRVRLAAVERLLLLVVATGSGGAAAAAERIELVDEDDAGRCLARLLEQIAHARRADADER